MVGGGKIVTKNVRKYNVRQHRSKYMFPTRIIRSGPSKGDLRVGWREAKKHIEACLGYSIDHWVMRHTPTQWVWLKPIGVPRQQN
jgi:hypothetical protein